MEVKFFDRISAIKAEHWNCLVDDDMPFLRHEFLAALEQSGAVSREQGWEPAHACVYDGEQVVATAPGYIKWHSYGEYVFDWAWADAYQRHGLAYYPKYVTAIPFTPVVGARLAISETHQKDASLRGRVYTHYYDAVMTMLERRNCSSWHILFPEEGHAREGLSQRVGTQFHWHNRGYQCFDDFLAALSASRRKSMRKERRRCEQAGLQFDWRSGGELSEAEQRHVYRCYAATYLKRGQQPYLNARFFECLWRDMPASTQILLVKNASSLVASALFFVGSETLYGRYWGCLEEYDGLHFEACYYRGIERCIALGLGRFDAGAQGEHKLLRGFEPQATRSYHWLAHPGFAEAVDEYVTAEARQVKQYAEQAEGYLPYRKDTP